jgi:hypothetical protein
MNTTSPITDLPSSPAQPASQPHVELRNQARRIQGLIGRGLSSGNTSLIHDAGKLLESFSAFGSRHRLYAKMASELMEINQQIPYETTLRAIEGGRSSSEGLAVLFQYIAPPFSQIGAFIQRAPDVVADALEAIFRNGGSKDLELNELMDDLHGLSDTRALVTLLEYKLDQYRTGETETFNVPYLISEYFSQTNMPASLQDAGALGQFLIRELPALTTDAEREEASGNSGQSHMFYLGALEMFAASGFKQEASRMAVFYLDFNTPEDPRSKSRLANLGLGETVAEQTYAIIGTLRSISTPHLNFFLESPLISTEQFFTILGVGDSRLNATGIMNALGFALSVYDRMDQANRELLIEKSSFAIDRFVELLGAYSQGMRRELVAGLRSVYCAYRPLDQAGKTMLEEKTIWAINHCMMELDINPSQKQEVQRQILALENLPKPVWESFEWMHTQTLEADLGL